MAALPKPLSQKAIQKLFQDWKTETVDILHDYYNAFSNLYGVIMLSDAWKIMKHYEPKIRKKEFMDFSSIARREDLPYYILEIDELYSEEPRISNAQRFIVNKTLVLNGYYRFTHIYKLIELQENKPFYLPDKMTDFRENADCLQWKVLCDYIRNIKTHEGVKLSELVLLSKMDKFDLEYYKSSKKRENTLKKASKPFSERVIENILLDMHIGGDPLTYLSDVFEEADANLTMAKFEKLMQLWQDANNHSHIWANRGWTPIELRQKYENPPPRTMRFGLGLQQAFSNGDIDKGELIEQLKSMGITVEE